MRNTSRKHLSRPLDARGMTLLEVMISLVILAVGLLGLSGMQATAMRSNSSGFQSSRALALADQRLQELANNVSFLDPSLSAGTHDANSIPAVAVETINNVVYTKQYVVTDNSPVVGVRRIVYTVSWTDTRAHSVNLITWVGNPDLG